MKYQDQIKKESQVKFRSKIMKQKRQIIKMNIYQKL